MDDVLSRIRSLAASQAVREVELRASFVALEGRIVGALVGSEMQVNSDQSGV